MYHYTASDGNIAIVVGNVWKFKIEMLVWDLSVLLTDDLQLDSEDLGAYKINETSEVTIGEADTPLSELFDKVNNSQPRYLTAPV